MKNIIIIFSLVLFISCKKAVIGATEKESIAIPWTDTSSKHPLNTNLSALLEKYRLKGLPGISLLVNTGKGTWVGATGKADIEKNIPFEVGQVSQVASITKLFIGTLVFKLIEDSANTGLNYRSLNQPITTWLPHTLTDKLANGNTITLGDCLRHETGVPDIIEQDKFYLAVLNNPNKLWTAMELLDFVYEKPAIFKARDTAIYSNTNTLLVSLVLDAATSKK
ncbi:MAG TPA: serine hydrolase, partial [Chitinophagaceae bacterium]|nr:serine hydrolase [Chitinophagaceae bacterium]